MQERDWRLAQREEDEDEDEEEELEALFISVLTVGPRAHLRAVLACMVSTAPARTMRRSSTQTHCDAPAGWEMRCRSCSSWTRCKIVTFFLRALVLGSMLGVDGESFVSTFLGH